MTEDITKKKHMNFKEIAAYSLGLFGFQAIVGLLNSYQAEFDSSILGADIAVVGILILIAKIVSAVFDPVVGNMIDRCRLDYVVDFLYFSLINFPIFNVADIYVTLSAIFLVVLLLFVYKESDLNFLSLRTKKYRDVK